MLLNKNKAQVESSIGMQLVRLFVTPHKSLLAGIAVLLLASCASASSTGSDSLTDANIAAIVVGANQIDISAAKIALDRSKNERVRKFAQTMIDDHQSVLNSAVELVTKLGVIPINNDLTATLSEQSKQHEEALKLLTGKEFDKSYIDHEVAYHIAVIGVIENQLIPGAKNQELKDLLISVLPAFRVHLKHCQMIQSKI